MSLELRASAVTERADVVLPVAPAVEKSGTFVDWEGRERPFAEVLRGTNALPDTRVLHVLAAAMDVDLGLPGVADARAEIAELGQWDGDRAAGPKAKVGAATRPGTGEAVLATWHLLLDAGRLQDGEPFLAATAHRPVARLGPAAAEALGLGDGDELTVVDGRRLDHASARRHTRHGRRCRLGAHQQPGLRRPGHAAGRRRRRRTDQCRGCRVTSTLLAAPEVPGFGADPWWLVLGKALFVFVFLVVMTLFTIWWERRVVARMQHRIGPNRVGPFGLLQSLADGIKLALKEDIIPKAADKAVFILAPIIATIPAFMAFAVIPFGPVRSAISGHETNAAADRPAGGGALHPRRRVGRHLRHRPGRLVQRLDVPAARRPALVGPDDLLRDRDGRSSFVACVPLRRLDVDVADRRRAGPAVVRRRCSLPSFVIYVVSMVGETNRAPFDLPEAEGELVGGFHTEYSSLKFALFFLAEYVNMVTVSALATTLFLGGWQAPWPLGGRSGRAPTRAGGRCCGSSASCWSSCSSSSGCAARCRGCATTSS